MNENPPSPAEVAPGLPPELVAVIEKTLEKDRSNRFSSCAELKASLMAVLEVLSGPVGAPPRSASGEEPLPPGLERSGAPAWTSASSSRRRDRLQRPTCRFGRRPRRRPARFRSRPAPRRPAARSRSSSAHSRSSSSSEGVSAGFFSVPARGRRTPRVELPSPSDARPVCDTDSGIDRSGDAARFDRRSDSRSDGRSDDRTDRGRDRHGRHFLERLRSALDRRRASRQRPESEELHPFARPARRFLRERRVRSDQGPVRRDGRREHPGRADFPPLGQLWISVNPDAFGAEILVDGVAGRAGRECPSQEDGRRGDPARPGAPPGVRAGGAVGRSLRTGQGDRGLHPEAEVGPRRRIPR